MAASMYLVPIFSPRFPIEALEDDLIATSGSWPRAGGSTTLHSFPLDPFSCPWGNPIYFSKSMDPDFPLISQMELKL